MNLTITIKKHLILAINCIVFSSSILMFSQEDLLKEIDVDTLPNNAYEQAVFKGLKIVNFESTKMVAKSQLVFIVSHRFGTIKNGIDTFFGLDDAVTRLNFVYGVSDGFNIGISRSSYQKIYEASIKYRIARQDSNGFPFTIVGYNDLLINTALDENDISSIEFKDRLGYSIQLLISRKINSSLSLELAPTYFYDGYVRVSEQEQSQLALGIGGRVKLSKRWSLNADYGWHMNRADTSPYKNPLSIGFDLETGGHVFQLHFTNAQPMNTNAYLGQATGDWSDGNIYFGFNLSRTF